ncbi:MAG: hypothetical protein QFX36_04015 [Archaeoglobales archaeon]|nr:hypothetical protein [Archaeoglobales archaeon]
MAWIKGITEALKGLAKTSKTAKTTKTVKPVVKAPAVATTAKVAKTAKTATEQVKTVKALRVASGKVAGEIPKAVRSSKGLSKGALAVAGFGAGAITAMSLASSPVSAEEKKEEDNNQDVEPEDRARRDKNTTDTIIGTGAEEQTFSDQLEDWASNALAPLKGIPIIGDAIAEAEENGLAFPFLILLCGVGAFVIYKVYKAYSKPTKTRTTTKVRTKYVFAKPVVPA